MDKYVNATEVMDFALQIEQNGELFYRHALSIVQDERIKKQLESLAGWEAGHVDHIKKVVLEISGPANEFPFYFSSEEDNTLYLKSLADNHIFVKSPNIDGLIKGCTTVSAMLTLALQFEQDSVDFYRSIEAKLVNEDAKIAVGKIAHEEEIHVAQIKKIIAEL